MSQDQIEIGVCGLCGTGFRRSREAIKFNDSLVHNECARVTLDQHWSSWEWDYYGKSPDRFRERLNAWRLNMSRIDRLVSRDEAMMSGRESRREQRIDFIIKLANLDKWLATYRDLRRADAITAARALGELEDSVQSLLDSEQGRELLSWRIVRKAGIVK